MPDDRWLNVRPDPLDFRDCFFEARLTDLPPRLDPHPSLADLAVRDQGYLSACTGMALAVAIDVLRRRAAPGGATSAQPPTVSARMLYEMGQAFDELPDDGLPGSSVRGALRGFFHNGVCPEAEDDDPERTPPNNWRFTVEKAKAAREVMLGVYMRIRHVLLDYHSALREAGVLVVSAKIHDGWKNVTDDGHIPWDGTQPMIGGHAFALVGYDDEGFLVRNSWGCGWGGVTVSGTRFPGVARWSYEDWERNVMDAWALRLAVPTRLGARTVGGFFDANGRRTGARRISAPRILVNGHYLHMQDGRCVSRGTYNCDRESIGETARVLAGTTDYDHLLIAVESGLDDLDTMVERAAVLVPYLKSNRIYPFFIWWRADVFRVASELLEDRARRLEPRTGGLPQLAAHLLGTFAREFMQPVWRTFEGEAERAFETRKGTTRGHGWVCMQELIGAAIDRKDKRSLGVHAIAHGAGAVWLAKLCTLLQRARQGGTFSRIALLAPICPPAAFVGKPQLWVRPPSEAPPPLDVYTLDEPDEANDQVGAYRGSFLELARSISGEARDDMTRKAVVLGHATVAKPLDGKKLSWFPVSSINPRCRTHRDLGNDVGILDHLLKRLLRPGGGSSSAEPRLPVSIP